MRDVVRISQEVRDQSKKVNRGSRAANQEAARAISLKEINLKEINLREINLKGGNPKVVSRKVVAKEKAINKGIRVEIIRETKAITRTVEDLVQIRGILNAEILSEATMTDAIPIGIIRAKEILTTAIQIKKGIVIQTPKISNENIFCIVPPWRGVMGVRR